MVDHLGCRIPVAIGIYLVQAMSKDAHRRIPVLQCPAMYMDIHAIGQSTDHQHLLAVMTKVADKPTDQVLSIRRALTGTHDTDDLRLVQVSITFII